MAFAKFLVITRIVHNSNAHLFKYTASCPQTQDFNVRVVLENGERCGLITKDDILVRIFGKLFEGKVDFCLTFLVFILNTQKIYTYK